MRQIWDTLSLVKSIIISVREETFQLSATELIGLGQLANESGNFALYNIYISITTIYLYSTTLLSYIYMVVVYIY